MAEQSLRKGEVGGSTPLIGSNKMNKPRYSRLEKIEQKKAKRVAFLYSMLTMILIVTMIFFGIPFLSKFAGFLFNLSSSENPVEIFDTTPPAPPRIDGFSEYTNNSRINISGTAEPASTITLDINGNEKEVIASNEGRFHFDLNLAQEENTIYLIATDSNGNKSAPTEKIKIIYDKIPPEISISEPEDGKIFSGNDQKRINIKGSLSEDAELSINEKVAIVSSDKTFSHQITLEEGENTLKLVAKDKAGNKKELVLKVTYSP